MTNETITELEDENEELKAKVEKLEEQLSNENEEQDRTKILPIWRQCYSVKVTDKARGPKFCRKRLAHFSLDARTNCYRSLLTVMQKTVILLFEAKIRQIRRVVCLFYLPFHLIIII